METRDIREYKVYGLALADMRGSVDSYQLVAAFDSRERLQSYLDALRVDPYTDSPSADAFGQVHSYHKVFRKGSLLEWFNPPWEERQIFEQWVSFNPIQEPSRCSAPFNPEP